MPSAIFMDLQLPATSIFRRRDFALFWTSRSLLTLATQMLSVAIGWQVYALARLTHTVEQSAFLVGMVGLAQFGPMFLLTLPAGAAADRLDRRMVVQVSLAGHGACAVLLAGLSLTAHPSLRAIFAVAFLFGATRAFLTPPSAAMAPMLVPREDLPRAIAWNSMARQSGAIGGPFLGGLLVAISPALAYGVAGLLYTIAAGALVGLRADTRPTGPFGSHLAAVREGLAYVWTNKVVFGAISLDLVAVLLGGATALLPVYAHDVLKVGPTGFGVLRAGPSLGAVLVAIWLSRHPIRRRAGRWMFAGVALFGVATCVFALSPWLPLSVLALSLLGAGDALSVNVRQTLVQIVTPDNMRGRVSAMSSLFVGASNELGEFESGVVAGVLGPVAAALAGGVGAIIATGAWAKLFPALREADSLTRAPDEPRTHAEGALVVEAMKVVHPGSG